MSITRGKKSAGDLVTKREFDNLAREFPGFEKDIEPINIFRILKLDHREIRHSNFLGWLLQPAESHGLGSVFLRGLLTRICREARKRDELKLIQNALAGSPVVEVVREWGTGDDRFLDLLLRVRRSRNQDLVIAIENKLGAKQGDGQLKAYREAVSRAFPKEAKRLYIFLSKRDQAPHDRNWLRADYKQVRAELREAHSQKKATVGKQAELINQYLEILEDEDMNEKSNRTKAQEFYSKHRRAIDVLIKYKPGYELNLTDELKAQVADHAEAAKVKMMTCEKHYVRFLPKALDTAINRRGTAWGDTGSAHVLCEIEFHEGLVPKFGIVEGRIPSELRSKLLKLAYEKKFPGMEKKRRPSPDYNWLYTETWEKKVGESDFPYERKAASEIWNWVRKVMETKRFRNAVSKIASELETLADKPPEAD